MSTFSITVTKAQRDASGTDARGFAVSPDSRHNINSPGYNRSPYEPKVVPKTQKLRSFGKALEEKVLGPSKQKAGHVKLQVRPATKRRQRQAALHSKDVILPVTPLEEFLETSCELATPRGIFYAIWSMSHSKPCIGCSYDVHSKTGCPAKQQLLHAKGLWK